MRLQIDVSAILSICLGLTHSVPASKIGIVSGGMQPRLFILLLLGNILNVSGLIFPLPPDQNGKYDVNFNVLRSYKAVWETNHHALANIYGANGAAVAPHWFMTAWHLAQGLTTEDFFNDDFNRYDIEETVNLGNDLALVRV